MMNTFVNQNDMANLGGLTGSSSETPYNRVGWSARLVKGVGNGLRRIMTLFAQGLAEYGAAHGGLTLQHFCDRELPDPYRAESRRQRLLLDMPEPLSAMSLELHRLSLRNPSYDEDAPSSGWKN
jgi:hypothetical protein